jgi:hypothetical protein
MTAAGTTIEALPMSANQNVYININLNLNCCKFTIEIIAGSSFEQSQMIYKYIRVYDYEEGFINT